MNGLLLNHAVDRPGIADAAVNAKAQAAPPAIDFQQAPLHPPAVSQWEATSDPGERLVSHTRTTRVPFASGDTCVGNS